MTHPSSQHEWQTLARCLSIHDRWIETACSYFVDHPDLVVPSRLTTDEVRIAGDLFCKGGLLLHVDISLERDTYDKVRGLFYRYQAQFAEPPLRQIFRYDNDHTYEREGHPDAFHKHVFSDRTWREVEVVHVGRERFPTLMEVIDELYGWWLRKRVDPLIYP